MALAAALEHQGWVLRPETSLATDIQRIVYPLGALENAALAALAAAPPVRCACEVCNVEGLSLLRRRLLLKTLCVRVGRLLQIPSGLIIPPEPAVAWWDPFKRAWSDEFITEVEIIAEKRSVFTLPHEAGSSEGFASHSSLPDDPSAPRTGT